MVTIGMNYSVREGKEKVFEDACARVIETMRGIAGHADSHLFREVGERSRQYLIVSVWSSEQAFRDFVASDAFKKVTNWGAQNILEGRPSHTVYRT
ncbi:MAG TPA: antibiotic biosynthesis monooxygenase family protein [Myxococcota bacterium]|nr:antibiotic biosynthesis monooxygenase family protein [Myxococcota bacterium]